MGLMTGLRVGPWKAGSQFRPPAPSCHLVPRCASCRPRRQLAEARLWAQGSKAFSQGAKPGTQCSLRADWKSVVETHLYQHLLGKHHFKSRI